MEMYKHASRLGLRFLTNKGLLSIEQLWTLSLSDLSAAIKAVNALLKKENSDDLAFLNETTTQVDVENNLRFAILKDVYITKQSEKESARIALHTKENDQKIMEIIRRKQDGELEGKSIEELTALLSTAKK